MHLFPCRTRLFPGVQYMSSPSSSGNTCLWPEKGRLHCRLREESNLQDGDIVVTQACFHLGGLCSCVCIRVCGVLFQPSRSPEDRLGSASFVLIPSQPTKESLPWKQLESLQPSRLSFLDISIPSPRSSASPRQSSRSRSGSSTPNILVTISLAG